MDGLLKRREFCKFLSASILSLPYYRLLLETEAVASSTAPRALFVYIPAGITADQWFPKGSEEDFQLPYISAPLEPLKSELTIFQGLNTIGPSNHDGGPKQVFSGGGGDGTRLYSLDQKLADEFGGNSVKKRVAIGLGSSQSADGNLVSYSKDGIGVVTPDNPKAIFHDLFGNFAPSTTVNSSANQEKLDVLTGKKRIIDFVQEDMKSIVKLLGGEERKIFEAHVSALDELEVEIDNLMKGDDGGDLSESCSIDRVSKLMSTVDSTPSNWPKWYHKKSNIPKIAQVNKEMMVQAFACGITNIGLLQFGASNTQMPLNFEGLTETDTIHHLLSHEGGQSFYDVQRRMVEEVVDIANRFHSITLANGKTLLDESYIFTSSCIGGNPNNHDGRNIPCFLLGSAGGKLKKGRFLKYDGIAYNHLLVSLVQMSGLNDKTYGHQNYEGPLDKFF